MQPDQQQVVIDATGAQFATQSVVDLPPSDEHSLAANTKKTPIAISTSSSSSSSLQDQSHRDGSNDPQTDHDDKSEVIALLRDVAALRTALESSLASLA